MIELLIYGLVALVIFLLIDRSSAKSDAYWRGHDDGFLSSEISHAMMKMKEEENDETTKTEQE